MDIETLLEEAIQDEFEALKGVEAGTDAHKATVDSVVKLADRAIEMDKLKMEDKHKTEDREVDIQFKCKNFNEEKLDRWVKNGIAAAGIILPIGLTIWGAKKSWKFEEEGTITSMMGRGFMNRLFPKK